MEIELKPVFETFILELSMGKSKVTARKSTAGPSSSSRKVFGSSQSSSDVETLDQEVKSSSTDLFSSISNSSMNNFSANSKPKSNFPSIKPSPDVTPMELQIRQLELMEEQCDSLEKLVEIAAERRDIEREILEIKKRKLALMEKNMKK
ncbi:unnamed protein product [Allacma fusca]|uniref:Uncharacterized protein n=1 Tax=Allacma fusca TaxID=39272 RepID=A0A8J2JMH3_9HEXA|nr:unnamed protein product [Allacma fusca]